MEAPAARAPAALLFNTLERLDQSPPHALESPIPGLEAVQRRARAKSLSDPIARRLVGAVSGVDPDWATRYRRTLDCAAIIHQEDGTTRTWYCGARWCVTCSRIRTARSIARYAEVLDGLEDPQFVTLTRRNCRPEDLPKVYAQMTGDYLRNVRAIRRTDGLPFRALRKMESTVNAKAGTLHPHFHSIVEGADTAEALRSRWLADHRDTATWKAQDVRPADPGSMKELLKYATKLVTRTSEGFEMVRPDLLHATFAGLYRKRTLQPYGLDGTAPDDDEDEPLKVKGGTPVKRPSETLDWIWQSEAFDWVDMSTGEALSEYAPGAGFLGLLDALGGVPSEEAPTPAPQPRDAPRLPVPG